MHTTTYSLPNTLHPVDIPKAKRMFDIIISLMLLITLSPLFVLITLSILFEGLFFPSSRGPIFYREIRISKGKPFQFIKYRIFTTKALECAKNSNGVIHTKNLEHSKKNMTYVGRLLKKVYFDELPQLLNVLAGDMSLVGPRPTNKENAENSLRTGKYSKYLITAGITGYFQSHKGKKLNGNQEEYDMSYIRFVQQSPSWKVIFYDIKILIISIVTILRAEGI